MTDQENELMLVYGTRAVLEAIHSGKELERVFVQQGLNNPLMRELKTALQDAGIHFLTVPPEKLNRMVKGNHQGVVAYLSSLTYFKVEELVPVVFEKGLTPLFLILDRITDTRNLGAIARTAECTGVNGIIVPSRGSALINSDAIKASAGALHHMPVCREDNLKNTIDYLRESGIMVLSCSEKAEKLTRETDMTMPLAIIMGSEENGVSPEYMKRSDGSVRLPMAGSVSSYNVSVAAGMILYEVLCQRLKK